MKSINYQRCNNTNLLPLTVDVENLFEQDTQRRNTLDINDQSSPKIIKRIVLFSPKKLNKIRNVISVKFIALI